MSNVLSYIGINLQSEVWQMSMPQELSLPVQRVLRTMISGIMLVQCFTVYVYLASYIVLLYPIFLEERPTLVLPWLLLAAIRKLLCELTSLALGLGTCVLLGPARSPCVRFLIAKLLSILPGVYMWSLVYSYYHDLKMATAFKTFPSALTPNNDPDYGLELAVRRRRTKSLQGEDQLRKRLIAHFYADRVPSAVNSSQLIDNSRKSFTNVSEEDVRLDIFDPSSIVANRTMSDLGTYYEDWFGSEVSVPRDIDRILEQFIIMLLRIGVYLKKDNVDINKFLNSSVNIIQIQSTIQCAPIAHDEDETPAVVGVSKCRMASYLRDYPNIFMKKSSDDPTLQSLHNMQLNSKIINGIKESENDEESNKQLGASEKDVSSSKYISNDNLGIKSKSTQMTKTKEVLRIGNLTNQSKDIEIKSNSQESIRSVIDRFKKRVNAVHTSHLALHNNSTTNNRQDSIKSRKRVKEKKD
ncbi:uncharacterized protein LOC126969824 isoform X2 [Leptidea sinapis]|uniref:uncharacterized protein LOC126969824 isoform X2 n=1 Tax=Leptidea sinapis TaxID=189913 RepID=UPI0021C47306|nr:uncharacterized protein LOC126969824 isoform X2 [Leptidea sinapis]